MVSLKSNEMLTIHLYIIQFAYSRKDLSLKDCKIDVLLVTGMLSPYASVVEKLHRDVNKERITMLKIERAGDVLADAVRPYQNFANSFYATHSLTKCFIRLFVSAGKSCALDFVVLQGSRSFNIRLYAWHRSWSSIFNQFWWFKRWKYVGSASFIARNVYGGIR